MQSFWLSQYRAHRHWVTLEKTTPPKHTPIPKTYHFVGSSTEPEVIPKRTIVRLHTSSGTRRTVGGLVPSLVVILTNVMSSTGQVRIQPTYRNHSMCMPFSRCIVTKPSSGEMMEEP